MEKNPYYFVPINFSLSERAREYIRDTIHQYCDKTGEDLVPVIVWISDGTDPDGAWRKIDAPGLGADERSKFDERTIQNIDGLELVFNVPTEKVAVFENQLVDFTEGRGFYFVGHRTWPTDSA